MGKRGRKILIYISVGVLVLTSHPIWLPAPARFLMVKDNVAKADAIMMLSGDWSFGREGKAIELYKKGFANKIIRTFERENRGFDIIAKLLNSDVTQEDAYIRYFETNGVPRNAIILGEAVATSTFNELMAVRDIALKNNFKSIILVTSDYHMRRALMTARWLFKSKGVAIYHATMYSDGLNPDRWWLHEEDIRGVIFEFLSILLYVSYHFTTGR